ncbi:MAG: right-handed parallel beta-helix repeat-containing protein [Halieaceae bacterium]|jgi:hypothetical protein|nr:right-handed parallel beta-helix repeat-containing protein [Halieaceae bacterium]
MTKARGSSFDARRYGSISAADYGVTGDGTTDDGAAVLAALTALRDNDDVGELYFPPGTPLLTTPVSIDWSTATGPKRILGASGHVVFNCTGDGAVGITIIDADELEIEGLGFEGTDSATGTAEAAGLALTRDAVPGFPRSTHIRNCRFEHFKRQGSTTINSQTTRGGGCGLYLGPGTHVSVDECVFTDNHQGMVGRSCGDLTVTRCRVDTTYAWGMDFEVGGQTRVRDCAFTACGVTGTTFSETVNAVSNVPYGGIIFEDFDEQQVEVQGCGFTQSIGGISAIDGAILNILGCTFAPRDKANDGDFMVFARRCYGVRIDGNFFTCPASGSANYDLVSIGSTSTVPATALSFRGNHVRPSGTIDHVLEMDPGSGRFVNLQAHANCIGDEESASDWSITDVFQLVSGTIDGAIADNVLIAGTGSTGCDITDVLDTSGGTVGTLVAYRNREVEVGSGAITNKINQQIAQDYTATNVTTDRAFDADSTTVAELADVVGTLLADLAAIGITR